MVRARDRNTTAEEEVEEDDESLIPLSGRQAARQAGLSILGLLGSPSFP